LNAYCHYHPADAARWHCDECQRFYCTACMPDADIRRRRGICPHCNRALQYRNDAVRIPPFWERTGSVFRYPLATDSLAVITICTLVPMLFSHSLMGLVLTAMLVAALIKYDYAVLTRTASGRMTPPPLLEAFSREGFSMALLQLGLFVAMGALVFLAARIGGGALALIATVFLIAALPAAIMTLALEQNIIQAVNPLHLTSLMARIGWPYVILCTYLILLLLTAGATRDFAAGHFPGYAGRALSGAVNSYFTLILFHLLGYTLYQYRDALGLDTGPDPNEDDRETVTRHPEQRRDADLDMALKDGRYDRAQTLIMESLRREPHNAFRLQQLYRLLCARDDTAELYRQQERLLPWLLDQPDPGPVLDYLKILADHDPAFQITDPETAHRCARLLYRMGEYRWVLRLLKDFHKRFPDYPDLAAAYLLVARTLANGLQQWDKAEPFLRFIEKRCPGHPVHDQLPACRARLAAREPLPDELPQGR